MPRGRYQQIQWEARQSAILDALETLAAEQRFADVTMDDVADAVGISKATLYQHFESKDALLIAAIARQVDAFIAWLEEIADLPPVEQLRRTARHLIEHRRSPLQGMISTGREDILPVFRRSPALIERHDRIIAMLSAIIQAGQAGGSIAPDLAPRTIITAMLALSTVSVGPADDPDHADQVITLLERAIRPVE
jgi:AcrR family transcriptional regulator